MFIMTLALIGTGIAFDLTLAGLDTIKACKEAYIESYTNPIVEKTQKDIEHLAKKSIMHIGREKVESDFLILRAKETEVCLLCSGDPLIATTHISLLVDAKAKGIRTKVIHNSSIYSVAPGRAGLQAYRFGKTATLVNPKPNYKPTSSLQIIRDNQMRDLHTLVLLDTEPQPMEAKDALGMLSEFKEAVVLSRLGWENERIIHGKIEEIQKMDLGNAPFTIIIPAKLHPIEEEYLDEI